MGSKSYKELTVWKKAHDVVLEVYRMTRSFPVEERYGLSSQMRRSAVSMPANIAEGFGRRKPQDKSRFYTIARSSGEELSYYLLLSKDLGYVEETAPAENTLDEVFRMLRRLDQVTTRNV